MAAATNGAYDRGTDRHTTDKKGNDSPLNTVKSDVNTVGGFWTKVSNDAIFNLAAMLAYNLLMSAFPILLVILAIGGFVLSTVSPNGQANLEHSIGGALPGGSALFVNVQHNLTHSAGVLLVVGIVLAIISGSGLFLTMEWTFGIVYRLRGRNPIRQRLMSIGMLLLYAILIPIVLLASVIPATVVRATGGGGNSPIFGFVVQAVGDLFSVLVAAILIGVMYIVVPNRKVQWREVWKGTLFAAVLLVLYETLFPIYVSVFLKPQNYGSTAGFAVVILIFFYYLAFILVLGAEINSWAAGQRQTSGDIVSILHEVQAHNTTRGAAGPTAGMPQEDLQHHKGADAMRTPASAIEHERKDHKDDSTPPKFAETGVAAPGFTIEPQSERESVADETRDPYGGQPRHTSKTAKTTDEAIAQARALPQNDATSGHEEGHPGARPEDSRASAQSPHVVASSAPDALARPVGTAIAPAWADGLAASHPTGRFVPMRPLSRPARHALLGVLAAGTVAVLPVLRLVPDLLRDDNVPARHGPR